MNQYITGTLIKELREKQSLTQSELAERLGVSDKAVSKWETGKGFPDITLLEPISKIFNVSILELLSGNAVENENVSANMFKSKFYVCPICGNSIHSMGDTSISCHGITLPALEAEEEDEHHRLSIELVEDEYYVSIDHEMSKAHFISFMAAVSCDSVQIVKLYPEGSGAARFKRSGVRELYYYCNRDGLFKTRIKRK